MEVMMLTPSSLEKRIQRLERQRLAQRQVEKLPSWLVEFAGADCQLEPELLFLWFGGEERVTQTESMNITCAPCSPRTMLRF
jgi:hypothetical protein